MGRDGNSSTSQSHKPGNENGVGSAPTPGLHPLLARSPGQPQAAASSPTHPSSRGLHEFAVCRPADGDSVRSRIFRSRAQCPSDRLCECPWPSRTSQPYHLRKWRHSACSEIGECRCGKGDQPLVPFRSGPQVGSACLMKRLFRIPKVKLNHLPKSKTTLRRGWIGGFRGGSRGRRLRRCGTFHRGVSACVPRCDQRANLPSRR
jgi:hypothetical protein